MSQAMILDRRQSITLADTWTNLAGIPSGHLFGFKDLIILLMSLAVGFGRSNLVSGLKTLFIFWMLGWLLYTEIISLIVSSSWEAFKQSPSDSFLGSFPLCLCSFDYKAPLVLSHCLLGHHLSQHL